MCEIYSHPCEICGTLIDMHLGDYLTDSFEIQVFCFKHIPKTDVVIWETKNSWYSKTRQEYFTCGNPIHVGIRALTDNAIKNKDFNHPNFGQCDIIEDRK